MNESIADDGDCYVPDIPCSSVDDFGRDGTPDRYHMNDFWESSKYWLAIKGFDLYELRSPEGLPESYEFPKEWFTPTTSTASSLPYSKCAESKETVIRSFWTASRLAPARDQLGRDVMLKLVDKDNAQYRIFRLLSESQSDSFANPTTFPFVLPPVAILDTPHQYSIVAMPMWGNPIHLRDLKTVHECLRFIDCVLQGLTFLHDRRIAHRDICEMNIVINCYRLDQDAEHLRQDLHEHRGSDDVFYALMDFDQSIQLPLDVSLKECRRPASESEFGSMQYKPPDVALCEPEYNPFAFDVGMLGNLFRFHFSDVVPLVPSLSALFDRMTTHIVSERFTAAEASNFFRNTTGQLSDETHKTSIVLKAGFDRMVDSDAYWSKLTSELQVTWGRFRTPQPSRWEYFLDWAIGFPVGFRVISFVRRILRV